MAVHTCPFLLDPGRVIASGIEVGRLFKDITGTVDDAETAAFASIFDDMNDSLCDFNFCCIQWNTPKLHVHPSSFK